MMERTEEWPKWINEGRINIKEGMAINKQVIKHVNDWSTERMKEEKNKGMKKRQMKNCTAVI